MQGANRSVVGGEKSLLCDPGSELRLLLPYIGGRQERRVKVINGMTKQQQSTAIAGREPTKQTRPFEGQRLNSGQGE